MKTDCDERDEDYPRQDEEDSSSKDCHTLGAVGMAVGMNNSTMRHVVEAQKHH